MTAKEAVVKAVGLVEETGSEVVDTVLDWEFAAAIYRAQTRLELAKAGVGVGFGADGKITLFFEGVVP